MATAKQVRVEIVAGVDEAGRGPLAGPVVAAAVVLPPDFSALTRLKDSKRLSPKARWELFEIVRKEAAVGIGTASPKEIDALNIRRATFLAMQRATAKLKIVIRDSWLMGHAEDPDPPNTKHETRNVKFHLNLLVDGEPIGEFDCPCRYIVKGDAKVPVISAASIVAKVTRDRLMLRYHRRFPQFGFDQHKGYPTPLHLERLHRFGPCPIHRFSFKPVQKAMQLKLSRLTDF